MKQNKYFIVILLFTIHCSLFTALSQSWQELMDSTNYYQEKKDYQTALIWGRNALELAEKEFISTDTNYIKSLSNLYQIFFNLQKYDSSIYYCQKALELNRKIYKEENLEIANNLSWLGYFYSYLGKYDIIEPFYKEALEIRRRLIKEDHPELAQSINNMAFFYNSRGRYDEAEPLFKESLEMRRRFFKGDNSDLALSINNMAYFYNSRGRYAEAEQLYKEALEMRRRLFKGDNPNLAISINNIAAFYKDRGRYTEAEQLYKEALEMRKRLFKGDHIDLASSLNNMAVFYDARGRYSEAEQLYKEALEMRKRLFKSDHPDLARIKNNMAVFYELRGRISEAEPLYKEALEMQRRLFKGNHPDLALSINNMAVFYNSTGRYAESEPFYKEAIEMYRQLFKNDHLDLAACISNMAFFYNGNGSYDQAESLFKEALEMYRRLFKGEHPHLAKCINSLANFYFSRDRYADAEPLFKEAIEMRRRLFKDDHPDLATSILNMANFFVNSKRYEEAEHLFLEALQVYTKVLINYFPSLSEKDKMQFWNTMNWKFEEFLSFVKKRIKYNPMITINCYNNLLLTKGIILNSTQKVKNNILNFGDKNLIRKFEEWQFEREKIGRLYKLSQQQLKEKSINLDSVIASVNDKEKELSRLAEGFSDAFHMKQIKFIDIQNQLKPDETAIEIVRFRLRENFRWTDTVYYAALILKKNSKYPELILLKNGNELESAYINNYKQSVMNKIEDNDSYRQFWGPIAKKLKGINNVYISPDGVFNQLNLATLQNPKTKKYVIDEIDVQVVGSTRDLIEKNKYPQSKGNDSITLVAELFGNPQFNLEDSEYKQISSRYVSFSDRSYYNLPNTLDSTSRHGITPIPGTETEIENISSILINHKWRVNKHMGTDAVEEVIKSLRNPMILHIATHGMFLKDIETKDDNILGMETQRVRENPFLRSMLLLSGAENTLKNEISQYQQTDDGLLTAYEAMNLNLDKTDLVVLSACETGLGEIKNGEGVYGLQRAFQQAGAKSLIMSLWKVNDWTTQELMGNFYRNWTGGMTKRDAFKKAQLEIKKKYPEPYYWGAFVMVGE